ncbi:BatA domain-containing protein, partial [bacterium]|nr:BatA domain-containing protein [bacterium]
MSYGNPYFLIGLAGAALPLLIHLLTRDRVRRVSFSTLRFFARASQNILRRKRLQEAILVALRCLLCALLAMAFARPFLGDSSADTAVVVADTACALVVDLSGSMRRAGLPEALRAEAEAALDELSDGADAAALITFHGAPLVRMPLTKALGEIRSRLTLLSPGQGGTALAEAVREGGASLQRARARRKLVVLVSDLQRTGWHGAPADWKLPADVELVIRHVQPDEASDNVAIVEADFAQSTIVSPAPQPIAVRIANHGAVERKGVKVTLRIGEKEVDTQQVTLRPGASVPVRFRPAFERAGDNLATVTVAGEDSVPEDDVFHLNARAIPRIRVLVVAAHAETTRAGRIAFFLRAALAPGELSSFQVQTVEAARATAADVNRALVVVLANVDAVPAEAKAAMEQLLERGGGLLFLPGDAVSAETFNDTFRTLAPCTLLKALTPSGLGDHAGAAFGRIDYDHPVYAIFHRPHHGDLSLPRFTRFWEVTDSQLSRVLARFDDGRPAVVEHAVGNGIATMLVSAPDLRWNDLPLRAVFLPWLHQTVRHLAVRT